MSNFRIVDRLTRFSLPPSVEDWLPERHLARFVDVTQAPNDKQQVEPLYALRKQTPEPVFGIIKSVIGFRQFSLRGLDNVRGEWSLVTMSWNIRRLFTLKTA